MFNWRQWDSHKQRVATAFILAVPLFLVLSMGPYWSWLLLLAVVVPVGLWEFHGLAFEDRLPVQWRVPYFAMGILFPLGAALGGSAGLHAAVVAGFFVSLSCLLFFGPQDRSGIALISLLNLGWLYIAYLLSYVLLIGKAEQGRAWLFFIFAVTIAGDAGAYYTGKRFGRHKLYEIVSPKKTIEGSAGGLLSSMAVGTLYGLLFFGVAHNWQLLVLSAALAVIGQLGDLMESMIKRISGKKDSSQLLPGHGGLLDRLDSLLFTFPAVWLFLTWIIG